MGNCQKLTADRSTEPAYYAGTEEYDELQQDIKRYRNLAIEQEEDDILMYRKFISH